MLAWQESWGFVQFSDWPPDGVAEVSCRIAAAARVYVVEEYMVKVCSEVGS